MFLFPNELMVFTGCVIFYGMFCTIAYSSENRGKCTIAMLQHPVSSVLAVQRPLLRIVGYVAHVVVVVVWFVGVRRRHSCARSRSPLFSSYARCACERLDSRTPMSGQEEESVSSAQGEHAAATHTHTHTQMLVYCWPLGCKNDELATSMACVISLPKEPIKCEREWKLEWSTETEWNLMAFM